MDLLACMAWPGIQTYLYLNLAHLFFSEWKVHWQYGSAQSHGADDQCGGFPLINDMPVGYLQEKP